MNYLKSVTQAKVVKATTKEHIEIVPSSEVKTVIPSLSTRYTNVFESETCFFCLKKVSVAQSLLGITTYEQCSVCCNKFCGLCITKSKNLVPEHLLHKKTRNEKNQYWIGSNQCLPILKQSYMLDFLKIFDDEYNERKTKYFKSQEKMLSYQKPNVMEDTYARKAVRLAQILEVVATFTGFDFAFKTLKYAYYSKEIYNILITGEVISVLGPLLTAINKIGATELGAKGVSRAKQSNVGW